MPKTFATHKSTYYLCLATTIFYRILRLSDASVVGFGDSGSAEMITCVRDPGGGYLANFFAFHHETKKSALIKLTKICSNRLLQIWSYHSRW